VVAEIEGSGAVNLRHGRVLWGNWGFEKLGFCGG